MSITYLTMTINRIAVIFLFFILCSACSQTDSSQSSQTISASETLQEEEERQKDLVIEKMNLAKAITKKGAKTIEEEVLLDYDTTKWAELLRLDDSYILDLKYATEDNFVKEQLYECPRCFLRPVAAAALQKIHDSFKAKGFHIKLLDCYRPARVQQRLWDKVPNASYVTPPWKGSMHNRGLAVDLTLVDENGTELNMGTAYDFFGRKAHHTHTDLPKKVLENRKLLKTTMEKFGFKSIRTEWWHYSYVGKRFEIDDMEWECDH
ncbi:MAG: D-alanyl-D-alanine dipeptidase [Polaribacter sp.]|jgi:D-alanyl-D-alanine dipeptidase